MILLVVAAGLAAAPGPRVPLDSVAAVVERRVITRSEVQAEARLVLLDKAGPAAAGGALDDGLLGAVLDNMVAQELLALEARRTGIAVREVDVDQAVSSVKSRFASADDARAFLTRFGIDDELLRSRARRDVAAAALLTRTFADLRVSDDEADAWAASHPGTDRDAARVEVERRQKDARFQALMHRLQHDVEVRIVGSP